jgi:hypothetical protein
MRTFDIFLSSEIWPTSATPANNKQLALSHDKPLEFNTQNL